MDSRYDHLHHESAMYQLWERADAFNPDTLLEKKKLSRPFTIMMPPPNANDPLHIGHGMVMSIEDVLIRYHRMLGDDTLWLPGTDHAGIETQFVFEKKLKKQGQSRFQFDRQTLYQMIWDYVQENSDVAVNQMKRLGASADWSRFMFMLDEKNVEIVLSTFQKLHADGLVYRDLRLVNFCTNCGTAFSDLEIDHVDQTTPLYYVRYPFVDDPTKHLTIATVRPEPIWADTHLAVHPDDVKNNHLIGKQVHNPLTNERMTIIADDFVDPEFGTGVVKLTPAHDENDFNVAKKHGLEIRPAISTYGKMHPEAPVGANLRVKAAREEVVKYLLEKNLIERIDEKYSNRIGICYRCKNIIEKLPLPQFFIKVKPLTKPILKSLKQKEFTVYGAGHDKILKYWLENLNDWNISRQIVWGIRMPIWYNIEKNPEIVVTYLDKNGTKKSELAGRFLYKNYPDSLEEMKTGIQEVHAPVGVSYVVSLTSPGENYIQETDTFDTWFSSSQWPVSTLKAVDLKHNTTTNFSRFYPTQVMETGYDILPFWVMRMLLMGKYATRSAEHPEGQLPFTDIYLHGLVRDQQGQKMSKSKGNVINPLEIIDQFGADALRMALVIRSTAGLDKSVSPADFKAMRNFGNKIWNASRFILTKDSENQPGVLGDSAANDQAFRARLATLVGNVTQQLNDFKIGLAAETVFNEFWHWYCDECIEANKRGELSQPTLIEGLMVFLKLLHPFMPFVTEAIWQEIRTTTSILVDSELLIHAEWPKSK